MPREHAKDERHDRVLFYPIAELLTQGRIGSTIHIEGNIKRKQRQCHPRHHGEAHNTPLLGVMKSCLAKGCATADERKLQAKAVVCGCRRD